MDPNLFYIDWEQLIEVLVVLVILSFLVERFLALIFEHRLYVQKLNKKGLKEIIAFGLSLAICWNFDFDFIAVLFTWGQTTLFGKIITAGVIAGGSKASVKLFHDLLKVKSSAIAEKGN